VPSITAYESTLVERFVASFEKLDEMKADEILDPVAWQLASGEADNLGWKSWRPARFSTDRSELDAIYAKLPARLPHLYERLVLSYRWAEVELGFFTLLANPPGATLSGLFHEMSKDQILWDVLLKKGFVRFGKGADFGYDAVCFDLSARKKNGDCRIVKVDHEEILCNNRVKVVAEVATSFENLVIATIEAGERKTSIG
jgi:hypothetical protein